MKKKYLWGQYDLHGYIIYDSSGEEIYTAGNARQDSGQCLPPDDKGALSLEEIRKFCIKTGKEMAKERKAKWDGADYHFNA